MGGVLILRTINGYVCVVHTTYEDLAILFGKPIDPALEYYENLVSNDYTPFSTIEEVKDARDKQLTRSDFQTVKISSLIMQVAQNEAELELNDFQKSRSLVVIFTTDMGKMLIGRIVKGKPGLGPRPGALMIRNGMQPIDNIKSARYIASEQSRQSDGSPAVIATFSLTIIPSEI